VGAAEAVPPGAAARAAVPAVAPGLAGAGAEAAVAGEPAVVAGQEARPAQSSPRRWYRRQG